MAAANGIRIDGRPITERSAIVDAPARLTTSCASLIRRAMSGKNGETSAETSAAS